MIIDHLGITASNYPASKAFFAAALAPLNIVLITEMQGWAAFGRAFARSTTPTITAPL